MSTDARISASRKPMVVAAAMLSAGNAGRERPIDSSSAPSAPSAELWRFIRCRVNPSSGPLYQSERGAHRTGNAGDGNQRATFFLQAGGASRAGEVCMLRRKDCLRKGSRSCGTIWIAPTHCF